jgi:hypothetical protein
VDVPVPNSSPGAGASDEAPALRRCIGIDRDAFGARYWSRQPLLTRADELPSAFLDLLSPDDIDTLVAERGLRMPFFRMVREGGILPGPTRYATAGSRRISDLIDADRARDSYADGATLVLQSLHRIHPPVVAFCRQLAADLGHPTQANAYITPPGNRGFDPHHDTHDVFVLQIDGSKRWHVFEPALPLPLQSQPSSDLAKERPLVPDGAEPVLSIDLNPGDALYLPRGYVHSAETNEDRSIHLTVGVLAMTAFDVLRDVLALAGDVPEFRDALPLGAGTDPDVLRDGVLPELLRRAGDWFAQLDPAAALGAVHRRLENAVPVEPLRLLASTDGVRTLAKESRVRVRRGLAWSLDSAIEAPDRVVLEVRRRQISLPGFVRPALEAVLAGTELSVADVAEASRGALDVDDALVLVGRLLREGVLVAT